MFFRFAGFFFLGRSLTPLKIGFLCQMIPHMRASPTSNVKPVHELRDDICDIDPKLKIILEGLQPGQVATEIKGMVELACRCIAILEPWNQARSKQPAAEKIIKRVQEDFNKFFNLLHRSKEVARSGCKGMQDLSSACFQLSRPTKETSQLKVLVEEISLPLRRADEQRKLIHTKFREARIRVIEISELMPSAMARIENERNKEIADTESRKEGLERQLGVLQSYASMPLALEETLRARSVKKNEARELHTRRCEDALQMLETVPDFLIQLEDCIAKFIRFWWRIEEIVRNVRERIADLGNFPMTWSLRMELAKQAWEEAVMAYHDYIMMIEYLCIIAPPVGTPPSSGRKIMGFLH
ncbi:hypothetical protein M413DRAFT_189915 [Hebeloma cylindrosporum]|uniref:Uncharacterized protein n=1 Tax=Hebeloma cylindrosporum TaxID=76867 RepID=A0A0C3BTK6_HEBCY|nr:hypothetical protein M413DRAFT_189915 [Hebeloma cylindrosporum h7]